MGNQTPTSITLDPMISTLPPIYAIVIPKILPATIPNKTEITPTLKEYRAPPTILKIHLCHEYLCQIKNPN